MNDYLKRTRSPWFSFLLVMPLLLLYQATTLLANWGEARSVVNGADALIQRLVHAVGVSGWLGSWLVLAAVAGIVVFRATPAKERKAPGGRDLFGAAVECAVYALVFGGIVALISKTVLPGYGYLRSGVPLSLSLGQQVSSSLGAGLYEELVFRLILLSGTAWALVKLGWKPAAALTTAAVASSLLFSLFHYVGPLGEPFTLTSFTFRAVAGMLLAGLYVARGFGIVAWTHALYDLFLLVSGTA